MNENKPFNLLHSILISDDIINTINNNLDFILRIIPELKDEFGFDQNHPHHHLDVWNHTLLALENSENDFEIRLALLLHDISKPFSYQDTDVRHFRGHELKSKEMSNLILKRISCPPDLLTRILYLIEYHDTVINVNELNDENKELIIKRLSMQYADAKAHHPDKVFLRIERIDAIKEQIENKIRK